jgi:hypothetical protein
MKPEMNRLEVKMKHMKPLLSAKCTRMKVIRVVLVKMHPASTAKWMKLDKLIQMTYIVDTNKALLQRSGEIR